MEVLSVGAISTTQMRGSLVHTSQTFFSEMNVKRNLDRESTSVRPQTFADMKFNSQCQWAYAAAIYCAHQFIGFPTGWTRKTCVLWNSCQYHIWTFKPWFNLANWKGMGCFVLGTTNDGYESFRIRVMGTNCHGYNLPWVRVVLVMSHPGRSCHGYEFSII